MSSFLSSSSHMLWSECMVDRSTTDLPFFGTYETSVELFVKPKIEDFSSSCLFGIIAGGMSAFDFRMVPTSVVFDLRRSSVGFRSVKKLSTVMFRPDPSIRCTRSLTCRYVPVYYYSNEIVNQPWPKFSCHIDRVWISYRHGMGTCFEILITFRRNFSDISIQSGDIAYFRL